MKVDGNHLTDYFSNRFIGTKAAAIALNNS